MNVAQEFDALYRAAQALDLGGGERAALVTITRTHGSTFRRAGASMLVLRDGRLVCELSGGCPQSDIALRARRAMDAGCAELVAYGRDANYDVMLETGCGGELEVLIEPLRQPADLAFLDAMAQLRSLRRQGTVATVYAMDGAAMPSPRRILRGEGVHWSDLQDQALRQHLADTLLAGAATTMQHRVAWAGRDLDVLVEPLHPAHALVVVGDGAGAQALAELSVQLGWQTTLVDPARSLSQAPAGARCVQAAPGALAGELALDAMTSAVLMTHRLERDFDYLGALLATPVGYVGVIGSRQRAMQIRAAFPNEAARLHVPAGLDVGSETPREIALAVAAEILALRNGKSGRPLSATDTPIHA